MLSNTRIPSTSTSTAHDVVSGRDTARDTPGGTSTHDIARKQNDKHVNLQTVYLQMTKEAAAKEQRDGSRHREPGGNEIDGRPHSPPALGECGPTFSSGMWCRRPLLFPPACSVGAPESALLLFPPACSVGAPESARRDSYPSTQTPTLVFP